jgi:hypothetical protein
VRFDATAQSIMFGAGATYPAGNGPWGIVSGDFNGDGFPDLAVANHRAGPSTFGNGVNVLLGKADGTFQSAVSYAGGVGPTQLISADFNRDGKLDLATANTESNSISVLFGNGDGTFKPAVDYFLGQRPTAIIAADFNRDGFLDFAIFQGSTVAVMLADGSGGFKTAVTYPVPAGSFGLSQGDFNHDGKLDIVTTSASTRAVSVLLGNGDGTFQPAINSSTGAGTQPSSVVVGDFNRDGKTDIAVALLVPPAIDVMLGNGDGSFGPPKAISGSINTPADLKIGDFNGDGKLDLVSSGIFIGSNADVFLGNGDGTFQTPVGFGSSPGAISVVVSDLNRDTRPDIALVVNGQVSVVMINATPGNPDKTDYFVHQHYLDFLSREPDVSGFDYWTQLIAQCANDPTCVKERRIGTSAAFLIETEFQQSGYFVYRLYKASYGRRPTYTEFTVDREKVIGGPQLENSKTALTSAFAATDAFKSVYPDSLSNRRFVDKLFDSAGLAPFAAERQAAFEALALGITDRASVLRGVVDNASLIQREYNPAFVQMQYFGYLRRNEDLIGYQFWLDVLNRQPGNYRGMVCNFITSAEYQRRFSNVVSHTNAECSP